MCNLSQDVDEKGRDEGDAESKAEERLSAVRNLMVSMGRSVEQAMEVLRVPEADRQKYAVWFPKQ